MRTCGTCPPFASVRLAANSSCYECLSISPNNILVGGGDVNVVVGSNDTFVYSTAPQFLADPTVFTSGVTSYTYLSGRSKLTDYPVGYPGNSEFSTEYQLDISINVLLSCAAGTPTSVAFVQLDLSSFVPSWVLLPILSSRQVVSGSVSCRASPNANGAWWQTYGWDASASINTEFAMTNAFCHLDYSIFWVNG